MDKQKVVSNVKNVGRLIMLFGSGSIVAAVVNNNLPKEERSVVKKITVPLTAFALTTAVTDAAIKQSDIFVDETVGSLVKNDNKPSSSETI